MSNFGVRFYNRNFSLESIKHECHYAKSVRVRSFSCSHFSAFGLNTEIYSVNLRIQPKPGKIRTRKTRSTDTFYAVINTERVKLVIYFQRNNQG